MSFHFCVSWTLTPDALEGNAKEDAGDDSRRIVETGHCFLHLCKKYAAARPVLGRVSILQKNKLYIFQKNG
jgi:hypothetical protein